MNGGKNVNTLELKKAYEEAKMKIVLFSTADVITTSGGGTLDPDGEGNGGEWTPVDPRDW